MPVKALAAVSREAGAPPALEAVELDDPRDGEVLVRMRGVGICHTDLLALSGALPARRPAVFGHEGAGVVERVGAGVDALAPGDHVVLSFDSCGGCGQCAADHPAYCTSFAERNYGGRRSDGSPTMWSADGEEISAGFLGQSSFATHAIATSRNAVRVPRGAPIELLGPLGCGLLTGAGTVFNVLRPEPGDGVAVFGCGAVGLAAVMAAAVSDAAPIIAVDRRPDRLALARRVGATHALPAGDEVVDAIRAVAHRGVRCSIDAVGTGAVVDQALRALRSPGRCATVGFQGPRNPITIDQGHLLFGRTLTGVIEGDADPRRDVPRLLVHQADGDFPFDALVEAFPFARIADALEAARGGRVVKPVLVFD